MAIPTSATSVALIDRLYNDGAGIVLHPETELKLVSMTTSQNVGTEQNPVFVEYIEKTSNNLSLNTELFWESATYPLVSASFCPLSAVVDGATQYADMYVNGGTATITQLPGSTGYGTLVVPITTATTIRPVSTATNGRVPTELAAAVALAGKENVLIGGSCVTLSRDAANTTVNVNAVTAIRAVPTNTDVPTEAAVKAALNTLDDIASTYADNAEGRANTYADNKAVTVENWVNTYYLTKVDAGTTYISLSTARANFVSKTDSATVNSLGIVKLHAEVTGQTDYAYLLPTEAAIKDYVDNHGGNGKPVASATNGAIYVDALTTSYTVSAQVKSPIHIPTTGNSAGYICVASANDYNTLGVVKIPQNSGLVVSNTGEIKLASATDSVIGGVQVPSNKGLTLGAGGSLTLSNAPVSSTFGAASTALTNSALGGVVVMMGDLGASAGNWSDIAQDAPVVPNISAMKQYTAANYVSKTDYATASSAGIVTVPPYLGLSIENGSLTIDPNETDFYKVRPNSAYTTSSLVRTSKQLIVDSNGAILYYTNVYGLNLNSSAPYQTIYAHVSHGANKTLTRAAALDSGGKYCWSSGGARFYTLLSTPAIKDPIYSNYRSPEDIWGHVLALNGATITMGYWSGAVDFTSSANTDSTYTVPIADVAWWGSNNVHVYQLHEGPVVSGATTGAGGKVVKAGAGLKVDTATDSYTVAYNGPFSVSPTGASDTTTGLPVSVGEGKVYWLDSASVMGGTTTSIKDGECLYMHGSSGADAAGHFHIATLNYTVNPNETVQSSGGVVLLDGWAGEFYTPIASNSGGTLYQVQFGDMKRETWGDDYRDEFNISRIGPVEYTDWNVNKAFTAEGSYLPYRFIIKNGGRILGVPNINVESGTEGSAAKTNRIAYPKTNITSGGVTSTYTDGLYVKVANANTVGDGTTFDEPRCDVWLNVWNGTWPSDSGGHAVGDLATDTKAWRYVVDTKCYEAEPTSYTYAENAYSIHLGYITKNGAPVQTHRGAADVRGRWT